MSSQKHTTERPEVNRRDWIAGVLLQHGYELKDAAAALNVSKSMISMLLSGEKRTPRLQRALAKLAGYDKRLTEFWGELLSDQIARGAA